MSTRATDAGTAATRSRILDATGVALAQFGPRKLSLTDIAQIAGVSRPTLYRHFASKEELLVALAAHEKLRYEAGLASALHGLTGNARLQAALQFIIDFQNDYPLRGLVLIEPGFMLEQLEHALHTMASAMVPLFEQGRSPTRAGRADAADIADLIVRVALSHFVIPGDDAQLLRELRHVAGI